ncbi:MAG TPA: hypothetical protein VF133_06720 [Terriglobales bacterium]
MPLNLTRGPIVQVNYIWSDDLDQAAPAPCAESVQPSFYTYKDLARYLNTTEGWVRRNARRTYTSDPIPSIRLGKNVLFDVQSKEFLAWLKRRGGRTQ